MQRIDSNKQTQKAIVNLPAWEQKLPQLTKQYAKNLPFPYIELDDFLSEQAAEKGRIDFPGVRDDGWIHYVHVNEKKHGLNKLELLPSSLKQIIEELQKPQFVRFISELTGIPGLMADPALEGGGLHQTQKGGFLNIHADFTVHPHKRHWRRRVNLLLYFNKNWEESYKGDLELWSRDMKQCETKIAPLFNRCVLFNTDEDSYHGLPDPIECPEAMTRKSIALYYFTEEKTLPRKRATNYRARPGDGLKSILIYADKQLISLYNSLKGTLGIDDQFASKILRFFNRKKRP